MSSGGAVEAGAGAGESSNGRCKSLSISMLICSNLCPDCQSSKSGGDPDARAHKIQKRRQEARILVQQAVP